MNIYVFGINYEQLIIIQLNRHSRVYPQQTNKSKFSSCGSRLHDKARNDFISFKNQQLISTASSSRSMLPDDFISFNKIKAFRPQVPYPKTQFGQPIHSAGDHLDVYSVQLGQDYELSLGDDKSPFLPQSNCLGTNGNFSQWA